MARQRLPAGAATPTPRTGSKIATVLRAVADELELYSRLDLWFAPLESGRGGVNQT